MKYKKESEKILEITAKQWKWINGKLTHVRLSIRDQEEIAMLKKILSKPFSDMEFAFYSNIVKEAGETVMPAPLQNTKAKSNFFSKNISKSHGKHNLPDELWERVRKIRNRPIQLIKKVTVGDKQAIHTIIPSGSKGYIIDYPKAFVLTNHDKARIDMAHGKSFPVALLQHPEVIFLQYDEFKIIPPFFDCSLACFVASEERHASA